MITHANLADNLKLIVTGLRAVDDTVVVAWAPQVRDNFFNKSTAKTLPKTAPFRLWRMNNKVVFSWSISSHQISKVNCSHISQPWNHNPPNMAVCSLGVFPIPFHLLRAGLRYSMLTCVHC